MSTGNADAPQQAQYVASVLRDIGYRPVTHLLTDDNVTYMPFISEPEP